MSESSAEVTLIKLPCLPLTLTLSRKGRGDQTGTALFQGTRKREKGPYALLDTTRGPCSIFRSPAFGAVR